MLEIVIHLKEGVNGFQSWKLHVLKTDLPATGQTELLLIKNLCNDGIQRT